MSSTTSSDCESCDCSQSTYSFENNHNDCGKLLMNSRHFPMYATMAHPLVYYAEVQPVNRRQTNDQPRKDNPFKKAFKWYTQERTLFNKNDVAPERSGFANWLDNKYVEYLRETGQQTKPPTSYESRAPKTSTAETCPPCSGKTKKFGRFKSPWKKRRRSYNDAGDVPKKCPDESCEFLLKPKELTRAASEACYHTPTSGGKSNSTVASSNMPCNTKCSGKSHSLSDVACENSVFNTVPHAVQECPNCQEQAPAKLATTSCVYHQKQGRSKLPNSMCMEQGPSKELDAADQLKPHCKCPPEKVPFCKCLQKQVLNVPSKEQSALNQLGLLCECLQQKVAEIEQVPTKGQDSTHQPEPFQEELPEVVKVLSNEQDSANQLKSLLETVPKVPSKAQDPTNQLGPCCKYNLEKVPKLVQALSQSRAVEESCQYPEEKVVPVHTSIKTQYKPATESPRSTQNLGPCCSNTWNKPIPLPLQMLCIPVKVQSNKIASPKLFLTIAPSQNEPPKKQKAKLLSVSCQCGEGNTLKVDTQTQHQRELSACCKDAAPSQNNCNCEINQVFGPIPIRRQSYSTVAINEETGEYSKVKEVAEVNKFTRSVTSTSNDAAQTSDHSIRFEKEYPLFFKIIYAEISKNE